MDLLNQDQNKPNKQIKMPLSEPFRAISEHRVRYSSDGLILTAINAILDKPTTIDEMAEAYVRIEKSRDVNNMYHYDATPFDTLMKLPGNFKTFEAMKFELRREYGDLFLKPMVSELVTKIWIMRGGNVMNEMGDPVMVHVSSRYTPKPRRFGLEV